MAMQTTEALAANIRKEHVLKLLLECFCCACAFGSRAGVCSALSALFADPAAAIAARSTAVAANAGAQLAPSFDWR